MDASRHHHRRRIGWIMDFHKMSRHRIIQLQSGVFIVQERQGRRWKDVYNANRKGLHGYVQAKEWIEKQTIKNEDKF